MVKTTFIYALCEPGTRTLRYIGKSNDPRIRLKEHLKASKYRDTYLGCWLRSLKNQAPELVILREVACEQWQFAEKRFIKLARGLGIKLVNGTDGGEGLHNPSTETRKKMSETWLGKFGLNHPIFGTKRTGSSSKYPGVSWDKLRNKWKARICLRGKDKLLGRFSTEQEARQVAEKALEEIK